MKQPKPDSMDYSELVQEIETGVIKIPDFQRDIVWSLEQTIQLLDSIAKGYPIGTFVFWESNDPLKSHRNIGNLDLKEVPEGRYVKYVLDGQQRITSVFACIREAKINGTPYVVFCDLDADPREEDLFSLTEDDSGRYVRLSDLLGEHQHLTYDTLTQTRKQRFNVLRDAFRLYKFPTVKVTEQPIETVCEIFGRINTTGTELSVFDVMVATSWSKEFDLKDRYEIFLQELEGKGVEGLGPSGFLQAVACVIKRSCRRKTILSIRRKEMHECWDICLDAIRHAIDFVRDGIGIPVWRLLPYPGVVAPLAYYFYKSEFRTPRKAQADILRAWFWSACAAERYSSSLDTKIGEDLKAMDTIAAGDAPTLYFAEPVRPAKVMDQEHTLSNAFCKTILCYLAAQRPLSFENGSRINLESSSLIKANSRQYHHFFPRNYLWNNRERIRAWYQSNSVANICFIPAGSNLRIGSKGPLEYLTEVEKSTNPKLADALFSHLIGPFDEFGIREDDFNKFLLARSKRIADGINALISPVLPKMQLSADL